MSKEVSRRQFLTGAGVATAGIVGAGFTALQPTQASGGSIGEDIASGESYLSSINWDSGFDVIVIGFGGAGASAAISASEEGASVLLIDKAPEHDEGGNTRVCEQALLAWQKTEDGKAFIKQLAQGHQDITDEIIDYMVAGTEENKPWMERLSGKEMRLGTGMVLDKDTLAILFSGVFGGAGMLADMFPVGWAVEVEEGMLEVHEFALWPDGTINNGRISGHSFDPPDNNEKKVWKFLRSHVATIDNITVWYNAPAVELIQDPSSKAIIGVAINHRGTKKNVYAKNGVVLSCGSYEANINMMETYAQRVGAYPIGSIFNTGDGILLAQRVGAQLWHMNSLEGPWIEVKVPGISRCFWSMNGGHRFTSQGKSILVSGNAKRFMAESGWQKHGHIPMGTTWINPHMPVDMWAIMDSGGYEDALAHRRVPADLYTEANTVEELAQKLGLDPTILKQTVDDYNKYCEQERDDEFARIPETLAALDEAPYYAIKLNQCFVNCQGGPKRNVACEVLDVDDRPIPHLYSAGELGSFWGGAYIAGGNLQEALYTGRTAGENAALEKTDAEIIEVTKTPEPTELIVLDDPASVVECGPNEYAGAAQGVGDQIVVKVTVDSGKMTKIDIVEQHETRTVVRDLFEIMPEMMIQTNSIDVDGISGATAASNGLKTAVANALAKAGL